MIVQEFSFPEDQLHYFLGLGSLITTDLDLDTIFDLIEYIQNRFGGTMLQFFDQRLVLNYNHIFYAAYHTLKTFHLKMNISNKMGIEFLLYMATSRQIKRAIEYYGIKTNQLCQGTIDYCIISMNDDIEIILSDILNEINLKEINLKFSNNSYAKYENIKAYFGINENQIKAVLKSYRMSVNDILSDRNKIKYLYLALEDLICEKMALLSLEKVSYD
ncbi:MAG: hypothetical protein EU552_00575 [Promethearchaeota archaeon]|nr:MAG: hypothetical protein EU552_00575 [Candidatus Lokiarchaeota archaeon]